MTKRFSLTSLLSTMVQICLANVKGMLFLHCLGWRELNRQKQSSIGDLFLRTPLDGCFASEWNTSPSIRFFIKHVHANVIGLRIFAYHDIKKWWIDVVLFRFKFNIVIYIYQKVLKGLRKLRLKQYSDRLKTCASFLQCIFRFKVSR